MSNKLIEKYPDNFRLRTLINLIPNIGGALDILLSEKGNKWREKRLTEFLSKLESRITSLESNISIKAIEELSNSEETYDLLIQSFNSVIKTRHSEKTSAYANILINHISHTIKSTYSSEIMISVLDVITIDEIEYLSALHKSEEDFITHTIFGIEVVWTECLSSIQKLQKAPNNGNEISKNSKFKYSLKIIWKMLSDRNIIEIDSKSGFEDLNYFYGGSNFRHSGYITSTEKKVYKITEFGVEFINWISEQKIN